MSDNGFPSMTALLGLLAVAGFQNRDKIAEWLGSHTGGTQPAGGGVPQSLPGGAQPGSMPAGQPGGLSGLPGALGGLLGGLTGAHRDPGSFLNSGLNDLVDRFHKNGQGSAAESWVNHGPNQQIGPQQLEQAIGADTLTSLTQQTGLSREELLARLAREVPQAVDNYTPDGRLPPRS